VTKIYLTPQELCNAIYGAVLNAGYPVSRLEICRTIERKKSPHILAMIDYLAENGFIKAELTLSRNGLEMFRYSVGERPADCSDAPEAE